ncbi:DUF305 domain-containing protein [Frigoribacterium sp. ACAM 257]|uniref:DUF305 domain-containing protein n=1 Tax=unclassified Frigoribacterium TaxID=2627005 RepID=UPI000F49A62C|nr:MULTISPECIES: DUF305 domain-containing protein [unclassified Frigoribacterium]ROS48313.1 uncharacterized protein (DUF305 family) [Frigoribacterium sp. PhB118]TWX38406.1 DUF305 domain-containing protein [Frigoribacterium sp. ACAM 257]
MNRTKTLLIGATAIVAALTLAGCADTSSDTASDTSASSESAVFNDQDVMFAQMMLPHHKQAVEMSDTFIAKGDSVDSDVATLAETIKDEQGPEIEQLTTWLDDWGQDTSASMDHSMDGMMSESDMTALDDAEGTDASRLFLEQMTEHHKGAVDMAQQEVDGGENPDAVEMAKNIVESQTAQIDQMESLLSSL